MYTIVGRCLRSHRGDRSHAEKILQHPTQIKFEMAEPPMGLDTGEPEVPLGREAENSPQGPEYFQPSAG